MKEALFWKKEKDKIRCELCPQNCLIAEGKVGFCGVRQNKNNKLFSLVYDKPCSINIDPIEKKPLYHFFPSETTFSIGTVGCNLSCLFCQNWEISKAKPDTFSIKTITAEQIVETAKEKGLKMIAYTYTEPTIFYEYMLDTAKLAKKAGLKNIIVCNGFINQEPLKELLKYIDAANIDLKSFDNKFYKNHCDAWIEPVLNTLKTIKQNKVHLEITNLIIPTKNDNLKEIEQMCKWIKENLGDTPIHFSRFFPYHEMKNILPTPIKTLEKAKQIAEKYLSNIHIGNV